MRRCRPNRQLLSSLRARRAQARHPASKDIAMNGAQLIAEILKREGTEFLSCYPRNPLIEACAAIDIRPILCRQERVGVGLADGYTRIKRGKHNGVFAAQAGPGGGKALPRPPPAPSRKRAPLGLSPRVPPAP